MSSDKPAKAGVKKYRVLTDTHTHNGEPLKKGDVIELRPSTAARFKDVFAPAESK
jgi:hypothetical protein